MVTKAARAKQQRQSQRHGPPPPGENVVRVFVSSPADVSLERDAAVRAIERVNQLFAPETRVEAVLWEHRTIPDLARPQELVFEDTDFDEVDILVGIFWSRIGTPTGGDDPATGREFAGGSVEELRAAEALRESGQLSRILLYFCNRPLPANDIQALEQRAAVLKLRQSYLESLSGRGWVTDYTAVSDFEALLYQHLSMAVSRVRGRRKTSPNRGSLVPSLCDRDPHEVQFRIFFNQGLNAPAKPIQGCVVAGGECEAHHSLVQRLIDGAVRTGIERTCGPEKGVVLPRPVSWPRRASLPEMKKHLAQALLLEFDEHYGGSEFDGAALASRPAFMRSEVVVIHHDVYLEDGWSAEQAELIRWYLGEYWSDLPARRPRIQIFLKLIVPAQGKKACDGLPAPVVADLERLAAESGECRRIVLPTLLPVQRSDVLDWFAKHWKLPQEHRSREADRVFRKVGRSPARASRCMAEVEVELARIMHDHPL